MRVAVKLVLTVSSRHAHEILFIFGEILRAGSQMRGMVTKTIKTMGLHIYNRK